MSKKTLTSPGLSDESRMVKLQNLALLQVEEELREKRATSQTLQHFLRLSTAEAELELEKTRLQTQLLEAKIETERAAGRMEETLDEVLRALSSYSAPHAEEYYD